MEDEFHLNISCAAAKVQPLPTSSLAQPHPGAADFSPDLVPRFLKPEHVEPTSRPTLAPLNVAHAPAVNPRVAQLDQDEFNQQLLRSLGTPTVQCEMHAIVATPVSHACTAAPASIEELQARFNQLKHSKHFAAVRSTCTMFACLMLL